MFKVCGLLVDVLWFKCVELGGYTHGEPSRQKSIWVKLLNFSQFLKNFYSTLFTVRWARFKQLGRRFSTQTTGLTIRTTHV